MLFSSLEGFIGGLERDKNNEEFAPYYADYANEVIFHVPSFMQNVDGDDQHVCGYVYVLNHVCCFYVL
jgi:hypothetical protein